MEISAYQPAQIRAPARQGAPTSGPSSLGSNDDRNAQLRTRAAELETAFLAEMLSYTGLGQQGEGFGGGIGADQFASFLRQEQAALMVAQGGIGLTEQLFRAMGGLADAG